jgi:hypothetical protein
MKMERKKKHTKKEKQKDRKVRSKRIDSLNKISTNFTTNVVFHFMMFQRPKVCSILLIFLATKTARTKQKTSFF